MKYGLIRSFGGLVSTGLAGLYSGSHKNKKGTKNLTKNMSGKYVLTAKGRKKQAKRIKRHASGKTSSKGYHQKHKKTYKPRKITMENRLSHLAVARRGKTRIGKVHGKKRDVKVSATFRKKVNKVFNDREPEGYLQETYVTNLHITSSNAQTVAQINGATSDGVTGQFFTPTQVLQAASVLWGGAGYTQTPQKDGLGYMNYSSVRINVIRSWATVKYRNNTQRTIYLSIYASRPKYNAASGQSMTAEWANALLNEKQGSTTPGINVGGITPSQLYVTPFISKAMMNQWKIETTKVVLQPGEEYIYTIEGPSKLYDFRKFFINGTWTPKTKVQIDLSHVAYTDLVQTNDGTLSGRLGENVSGFGLLFEVNTYYKLSMPEQAGILWATLGTGGQDSHQTLPANGAVTYLGNRRDAYYYYNNGTSSTSGTVNRVDLENPANVAGQ